MSRGRLRVTAQTASGRNTRFADRRTSRSLSRQELVRRIRRGAYPNYHIRMINGVATPVSNPDRSVQNNLG
jgi:hypothetical protein